MDVADVAVVKLAILVVGDILHSFALDLKNSYYTGITHSGMIYKQHNNYRSEHAHIPYYPSQQWTYGSQICTSQTVCLRIEENGVS